VFGELGDDHLGEHARSSNTTAQRTEGTFRGHHTITAVRARVLGQDVDVKLKAGWDELQHPSLILTDARLGLSAMRTNLFGLWDVVLDADLR
jgi:hypothetical protein